MENIAFDCHSDMCILFSADDILFIIANLQDLSFMLGKRLNVKDPNAVERETARNT